MICRTTPISPIKLEVFSNLFASVAEEMGTTLCRAALSPNIKERRDYSCILADSQGNMVAQAAHIPVHLGSAPLSVQAALHCIRMDPGDVVVLNDPFCGGTHLPDITMVAPVFCGSEKSQFYVAARAHHADIGGMSAGSMPLSTELFQEGLIIPPLQLVRRGELNNDLLALILANVRTPHERRGDIQAQIGCLRNGVTRLEAISRKYGCEETVCYARALQEHAEKVFRSLLAEIPDGIYSAVDFLDDDGSGHLDIPIRVSIKIEGNNVEVDFTGSADQVAGNLNAVPSIVTSSVLYVFRLILPGDIPSNSGILRPIRIHIPAGSLLNPRHPAAVAAGNVETSQRIVDVLLKALASALPDQIPAASQGTMNNLMLGSVGNHVSIPFAYYETIGGGAGAGPCGPGASGIHTHMTNTLNTPVEALEIDYPLLVERYRLRSNSGGTGLHKGGDGLERAIRFQSQATVTILSERRTRGPYGLHGGNAGKPGRNVLVREHGEIVVLPGKCSFEAYPGDIVEIITPGGGGWGTMDGVDLKDVEKG